MAKTISTVTGDLFAYLKPGDAFVHGCNAQGVMGSGIAASVREIYPAAYQVYRAEFEARGLDLGDVIPFYDPQTQVWVLNGITQNLYGKTGDRFVSYDAVTEVFENIRKGHKIGNIQRLFFPLIGAGLGGGNWRIIQTIIEEVFDGVDIPLILVRPDRVVQARGR